MPPPKRKRGDGDELSLEEKKRKIVPAKWTSTEVSQFVAAKARLTKTEAKCVEISGESLRAEPFTTVRDLRLRSVPEQKRESVVAACDALIDPLMPKFLLYDANGDGMLNSEEFMHLVCAHAGKIMPEKSEVDRMMAECDLDQNGGLDFEEFRSFVNTHESWAAKSVRSSVFAELLRAESSFIKAISPLFPRQPSLEVRGGVNGGSKKQQQPASSVQRLKLTPAAKISSNCCSFCLLLLLATLLFVPAILMADWAVEDFSNLEEDSKVSTELISPSGNATQFKNCKQFLKKNCPEFTADEEWSKKDYRGCSKLHHPDKGGSVELMVHLTECHEVALRGSPEFPRSAAYLAFLSLTIFVAFETVVTASASSTTAALALAIKRYVWDFPELGDLTNFPDLIASSRVFVVFITVALALLHGVLSLRGQSCLSQWLSGTKICDAATGRPVSHLRIHAFDLAAALSDAAIFALVVGVLTWIPGIISFQIESLLPILHWFLMTRFVLQWILNRAREHCTFAERITGTVLLWQSPASGSKDKGQ